MGRRGVTLDYASPAELQALTDRKHADAQIAWLTDQGVPFEVSAKGRPKVLRSVLLARSGQKTAAREPQVRP